MGDVLNDSSGDRQVPKPDFLTLLSRAKSGDDDAAAELLREFGPSLARIVRVRLTENLRRHSETVDVCQSVFGDIFLRLRLGTVDFDSPAAFLAYLARIARSRIVSRARHLATIRRDAGRLAETPVDELSIASSTPTPSFVVSTRELLGMALGRMTDEERFIAEQRLMNVEWRQIAEQLCKQEDAVRISFRRAISRIARECQE